MSDTEAPAKSASDADAIKYFQDFLKSYNQLTELCFIDCVWDFTTRSIKSQEEKCTVNCMEKKMKMRQRVSERFQEYQIAGNEHILAEAKKTGAIQ